LSLPELTVESMPVPLPPSDWHLVLSPDGRLAYQVVHVPGDLSRMDFQIHDLFRGIQLAQGFRNKGFSGLASGTQFSPESRWVVESLGHPSRLSVVRDALTGQKLAECAGFQGWVISAGWSPDATLLALGSADRGIHIYSTENWEKIALLKGHFGEVRAVAFSPDGSRLISGDKEGEVKVWSARDFPEAAGDFPVQLAFSRNGRFAWEMQEGPCALYSLPHLQLLQRFGHRIGAISGGGELVATLESGRVIVRNSHDGAIRAETHFPAEEVKGMAISDAADLLVLADNEKLHLWDFSGARTLDSIDLLTPPSSIVLSPGAERAAVISGIRVGLYSVREAGLRTVLSGHRNPVSDAAFSSDGKLLATAGWDASVYLWDASDGALLRSLQGQPFAFASVCFSNDGSRLAAGGADGTIRIWETREWNQVGLVSGHKSFVDSLAFGPGDSFLASSSEDFSRIYKAYRH
jgi:WD40 repeat protein